MMENKGNYNNVNLEQETALLSLEKVWLMIRLISENHLEEVANNGTGIADLMTAFSILEDAAAQSKENLSKAFPTYKQYLENRAKSNGRP